jgi:DNA-binding transcriptional MerR regulator
MNRNGLKIGEFSRLCRVTVRALRHYEKIKLLVPEIIDYSTGYRYYSVVQMQKALNIVRMLISAGVDINTVSRHMTHSSIVTTQQYFHLVNEKSREAAELIKLA